MQYQIKRGNTVVLTVTAPGKQQRQAMGVDVVNMSFSLPNSVNINIGDTVEVYGRTYKLNRPANVTKISSKQYDYTLEFEALFYDLAKVQLRGLDATNQLTEAEFTIMANAADIVDLIVRNANRLYSGYTIGVVDETELQNFIFNGENCLQALNRLADAFQSEFWIDNKTIHFQKREQSTGVVLSYGQGNGLYQLYRGKKNDADLVTRLYVEGGSRNLPEGYGKTRLQLPGPLNYIEVAGADEIIEATKIFENIIPERVGTVTGLGADMFTFIDSSMDFDINDHLSGKPAKIGFQTGALAGYEFELASYNAVSKEFKINLKTDEKAYPEGLPNDTLKPAVGDKYSVFDIYLPNSYVVDAQNRALAAGQAYLDKYKNVQYEYGANLTPIWVKQNSPNIVLGYTVQLVDTDMGIDKEIRIIGYSRDLQEPNTYDLELGDTISISEIVRQYAQQERILYAIQTAGLLDPEQMRKNLFLNRLSENNGYLIIGTEKVKSGLADYATLAARATLADYALDSDKWDGQQFIDFLNQPVRTVDSPKFEGVSSPLFVSGAFGSGYRISKYGDKYTLELDNLVVRDGFTANELIVNKINASNGAIAVSDYGKVKEVVVLASSTAVVSFEEGNTLQLNDILRCQIFTGSKIKYYLAYVLAIDEGYYTIDWMDGDLDQLTVGDVLVRVDNLSNADRRGLIYMTASDSGAPYMDVIDGFAAGNFAGRTKVRLGKLNGIVDPDFGDLSGYGIYAERGFFKGSIQVTGGNAATKDYANAQALNAQTTANSYTNTQFNVLDGKINLKADQAIVSDLGIRLNSAEAKITPEAINITVSSQVDNKVNAVQVGGRNYYRQNTVLDPMYGGVVTRENTETPYGFLFTGLASQYLALRLGDVIPEDGLWTISFWAKSNAHWTLYIDVCDNPADARTITPDWVYYELTFNVTRNGYSFVDFSNIPYVYFFVKYLKIERGNKATDWTPAPEDVQADINARPTQAEIKAGISITPGAINIFGNELSLAGKVTFSSLDAGAQNQINVIAQDKVNALQVGGRNYILKSKVVDAIGGAISGGSQAIVSDPKYGNVYEYSRPLHITSDFQYLFNLSPDVISLTNVDVVYFVIAKHMDSDGAFAFGGWPNTYARLSSTNSNFIDLGDGWKMYWSTFLTDIAGINSGYFGINSVNGTWRFFACGVLKGNKPSDWTPAPEDEPNARIALANSLKAMAFEDVVELGKLGQSVVNGGTIKGEVLDALYIRSVIVNAAYIQTIDLTADKITAGRLQSVGGGSYFDLNNNQFKVGSGDNSLDYNVTTPNQLTVKGRIEATSGKIGRLEILPEELYYRYGDYDVKISYGMTRPEISFGVWNGTNRSDGTKVSDYGVEATVLNGNNGQLLCDTQNVEINLTTSFVVQNHKEFKIINMLASGASMGGTEFSGKVRFFLSSGRRYLVIE